MSGDRRFERLGRSRLNDAMEHAGSLTRRKIAVIAVESVANRTVEYNELRVTTALV